MTYLALDGKTEEERRMRAHILDNVRKYRRDVMTDPRAEKRTRIACLLSFFGLGVVAGVYRLRAGAK